MKQSNTPNMPRYHQERKSDLVLPSSPYSNRNRIYTVGVNNQNINHFSINPPPIYKGNYQNNGNYQYQAMNPILKQSTVLDISRVLNENQFVSQQNQTTNLQQKLQTLRHVNSASDFNRGPRDSSSIKSSMIGNQTPRIQDSILVSSGHRIQDSALGSSGYRIQDSALGSSGYRNQNTSLVSSGHRNHNSCFGAPNNQSNPQTERNKELNNFSNGMIQSQFAGLSQTLKEICGKIDKMNKKMNKNGERITILERTFQQNSLVSSGITESDLTTLKQKITTQLKKQSALSANVNNDVISYMMKQEIDKIRKELKQFISNDCESKFSSAVHDIKDSYSYNNQTLDFTKRLNLQISSLKEEVRTQIKYVHSRLSRELDSHLQIQLSTIKEEVKRIVADTVKLEAQKVNLGTQKTETSKSLTQYAFKPLLLKYRGILKVESQRSMGMSYQIDCQQSIYHIDSQGYLLDQQRYYIIDTKGDKIRIPPAQVSKLKTLCLL